MESMLSSARPLTLPRSNIRSINRFSTKENNRFILNGRGWGHGVGLCQIGAAVMGEQGKPYDEILLFYYRNAEIQRLYE